MKVKSSHLVSSISGVSLGVVAGLRIRLAGTTYFSSLLSVSLLMPWYTGCTPGMACGILIFFDFFNF